MNQCTGPIMPRFRFSVRDLLWLTLVVALTLAWFVRDRQRGSDVDRSNSWASHWRSAAGALEHVRAGDGQILDWASDLSAVSVLGRSHYGLKARCQIAPAAREPSVQDD